MKPIQPGEVCIVVFEPDDLFRCNVGSFVTVIERLDCHDCGASMWSFKDASRPILIGYLDSTLRHPVRVNASSDHWSCPAFHANQLVPIRDPGDSVDSAVETKVGDGVGV